MADGAGDGQRRRRAVDLDAALSLHIHSFFLPLPRFILHFFEFSGDGRLWILLSFFLLPFFPFSRFLLSLIFGLFLDLIFLAALKSLVRRPRPVYNSNMSFAVAVDHWSFPSGHSSRSFFLASFLALAAAGEVSVAVVSLAFVWAVATSASRVLLGRHFVSDVVAGAGLGVLEAWLTCWFADLYYRHS